MVMILTSSSDPRSCLVAAIKRQKSKGVQVREA
jgi:hypothetical protein